MTRSGDDLDVREAIAGVDAGDLWLLDVREDGEWDAGHATAAHHIPMAELGLRQDELPDATIAVICHSGGRSRIVTDALVAADYPVVNVSGGMVAWQQAGGDVVRSPRP
jgi:rhodanese-related sulfurtransferase